MSNQANLTPEEVIISDEAHAWVKKHEGEIIGQLCGSSIPVAKPVSLFMAGSPGAGKTEVSKALMKRFETVPVRIDADEIRAVCPGYTGANAHVFQRAATKGVNILYDHVLHNNLHVILDGTFAYGDSLENIRRSLKHTRKVELWYVYQEPLKAWEFTMAREALEARRVSKEKFIEASFKSKRNTVSAKNEFGNSLTLNLLVKNIDNTDGQLHINIQGEELDRYIGHTYTAEELQSLLV
jgi:UDP-N-acetylglucosamine kinase